jgi:hypothetical protein
VTTLAELEKRALHDVENFGAKMSSFNAHNLLNLIADHRRMVKAMKDAVESGYVGYGQTHDVFNDCLSSLHFKGEG